MLSRWENLTRTLPPRIPSQIDPNQAKPNKDSVPPLARRPCVARVARGARVASYPKKPRTRHAPCALSRAYEQGTERSHMNGDSLGAAAGSAPGRSSLLADQRSSLV